MSQISRSTDLPPSRCEEMSSPNTTRTISCSIAVDIPDVSVKVNLIESGAKTCPAQYRFYYLENLRSKVQGSGLVFGAVMHIALADLFKNGADPVSSFLSQWEEVNGVELRYKERESWDSLKEKGKKLTEQFLAKELPKLRAVREVEKRFDLVIASLPLLFVGIMDLVAEVDGGTRDTIPITGHVAWFYSGSILSVKLQLQRLARETADNVGHFATDNARALPACELPPPPPAFCRVCLRWPPALVPSAVTANPARTVPARSVPPAPTQMAVPSTSPNWTTTRRRAWPVSQ
jgi:hypothetical protein